jgi:hypothetical protein
MEKQMRAERDKRASILTAEGARQSQILTAEGDKQGAILRAEGDRASAILRAEGEARSIDQVFAAVHRNDLDPRVLAYQYLQTLPQLARGEGNTFWVIPSEVTSALSGIAQAFSPGGAPFPSDEPPAGAGSPALAADRLAALAAVPASDPISTPLREATGTTATTAGDNGATRAYGTDTSPEEAAATGKDAAVRAPHPA